MVTGGKEGRSDWALWAILPIVAFTLNEIGSCWRVWRMGVISAYKMIALATLVRGLQEEEWGKGMGTRAEAERPIRKLLQ